MNRFRDTDDQLPVTRENARSRKTSEPDADERNRDCRPLERVEFDDTQLDLFVVDERTKLPIGRPWLTLRICAFTKLIIGYHLSLPQREHGAEK